MYNAVHSTTKSSSSATASPEENPPNVPFEGSCIKLIAGISPEDPSSSKAKKDISIELSSSIATSSFKASGIVLFAPD